MGAAPTRTSPGGRLRAVLLVGILFVTGCTTVPPARVTEFGQGVDKVQLQLDTTFDSVNQMVTQDEVDRAVTQPTLTEDTIAVVLKKDDIAKWNNAIVQIDSYVSNLALLLSPDQAQNFGSAAQKLGTEFANLKPTALPSAAVATGFVELGRLLIEVEAEKDALAVARKADPAIQKIFAEMAAAIGEDHSTGLRGTVWEHWITRMAAEKPAFLAAKGNVEAKRKIVLAYIDLRNKRDAQDLQLESLRQSLLELAFAHGALAHGSAVGLVAALDMIQQELDATRSLSDFFTSLKANGKTKP